MEMQWILGLNKCPEQQPQCKFRVDSDHSTAYSPCLKTSVAQEGFKQDVMILYLVGSDQVFFHDVLQMISKSMGGVWIHRVQAGPWL